jgi:hypothetical protein
MQRSASTRRPIAASRAPRAARAQAPAADILLRAAVLAALLLTLLVLTAMRAGAAPRAVAAPPSHTPHRSIDSLGAADAGVSAPSPRLGPEEVVGIILDALSRNDTPVKDHGIAVTFAFSSPANRAFVGPLDSFADLVRDETYRPLLYHRHATHGPAHINGDRATVRVVVTTAGGERVAYLFALSLQNDGEYKGCWMTDGVTREPPSSLTGMRFT